MSFLTYERLRLAREERAKPFADALAARMPNESYERHQQTARVLLDDRVVVTAEAYEALVSEIVEMRAKLRAFRDFLADEASR